MIVLVSICRVTVLLTLSLTSVSCQDSVVYGFVGEDVLLPCVYRQSQAAQLNIYWRDPNKSAVLNIVNNAENYKLQDKKYRDRVFSFSEQYQHRNFSIVLRNLRKNDSGKYNCHIEPLDADVIVTLTVSDKPEEKTVELDPPSGGAAALNLLQVALLSALCLLLCF